MLLLLGVFGVTLGGSTTAIAGHGGDDVSSHVTVLSAVEYDGHIELALNASTNGSAAGNFHVYVNGENVTDEYSVGAADGTSGRITLVRSSSFRDLTPRDDVVVDVENDGGVGNGNVTEGNVSVTTSGAHIGPAVADTDRVFNGTTVAYVTDSGTDVEFDLLSGADVVLNRRTGTNSAVYLIDTSSLSPGGTYAVRETATAKNTSFKLRRLALSISADPESLTVGEPVTLTAESNFTGRTVTVQLVRVGGEVAAEATETTDGDGTASATFTPTEAGEYFGRVIDHESGTTATTRSGSGSTPTATPSPSPTATVTPTPTATPTATRSPTPTASPSPSLTPTPSRSPSASPTATPFPSPTRTASQPTPSTGVPPTESPGQPGFGITTTLVAGLVAALLARRRS